MRRRPDITSRQLRATNSLSINRPLATIGAVWPD
jgi:hypothetical protein